MCQCGHVCPCINQVVHLRFLSISVGMLQLGKRKEIRNKNSYNATEIQVPHHNLYPHPHPYPTPLITNLFPASMDQICLDVPCIQTYRCGLSHLALGTGLGGLFPLM